MDAGKPFPERGKIGHFHLTKALSDGLPEQALIVTGSSGLGIEFFYTGFDNKEGQRVFLTSGLGAMGYGMPAMIGAYMASDRRPFFGVESDGSLMMNLQEMQTIASLNLPLRMFVINNRGYASIRNTQRNYFEGRYVGTGPEARLGLPDFPELARTFGWDAFVIDDAADLAPGIARGSAMRAAPCSSTSAWSRTKLCSRNPPPCFRTTALSFQCRSKTCLLCCHATNSAPT